MLLPSVQTGWQLRTFFDTQQGQAVRPVSVCPRRSWTYLTAQQACAFSFSFSVHTTGGTAVQGHQQPGEGQRYHADSVSQQDEFLPHCNSDSAEKRRVIVRVGGGHSFAGPRFH